MANRRCGGSSPIKEQKYKSHLTVERQNTLRKLERIYKRLVKASKIAKKKGKKRVSYFFERFPSIESYMKTIELKKIVGDN